MWIEVVVFTSVFINLVDGDCYLQNMRGSNDRLDGKNRERRNGNRLFDSQNNARGGYNAGLAMRYYAGSTIQLEWTNQHSCGEQNCNCELIIQYMCGKHIRDGETVQTIPENPAQCANKSCNTDLRFGMHENFEYYQTCKYTLRNHRLFTANQGLRSHTAKYTRQNAAGTRRGYECPEERDYYPYWRPSPWKDVVVMTNDLNRCDYYKNESQNVKPRSYCKPPAGYLTHVMTLRGWRHKNNINNYIPITEEECKKLKFPVVAGGNQTAERGEWTVVPSHNIPPPACIKSPRSRGNHNGNGISGETNKYMWKLPEAVNAPCVLRIRYNISTNDFAAWDTTSRDNTVGNGPQPGPAVAESLGMKERRAEDKGYYIRTNPIIEPFRYLVDGQDAGKKFKLRLAFNTAQFGRTFQDRSHMFFIVKRPADISPDAEIFNVNVRGKRGNIVQTYPATEYDFVPNSLHVPCGDTYIHFQWTGSNNNPHNNAGEGTRGTDRSNVCLMGPNKYPKGNSNLGNREIYGHYGVSYPADMRKGSNIFGVDRRSEVSLCTAGTIGGANGQLNNAGVYYNHKLFQCKCEEGVNGAKVNVSSIWHYMCTRNNNFTNRSQKAKIVCVNK